MFAGSEGLKIGGGE